MRNTLVRKRRAAGFTQYTIAAALGISRTHYAQIETGAKNPALNLALKIKDVLNYRDDDIFFDDGRPKTGHRGRPRKRKNRSQ